MTSERYTTIAVLLHWTLAALIVWQIYLGWVFHELPRGPERGAWFDWHKTVGIAILLLALVRLGWRIANPPPPYPADIAGWERTAARWSHRVFYFLIIAIPLTGLMAISKGKSGTTELLGGVPFPLIPGIPKDWNPGGAHEVLVFATVGLLAIHIAAALKHQFFDKSRVAGRMPPFRASDR